MHATTSPPQVRQFEGLLSPLLAPPLAALPNAQMAWASMAVEELARLGVSTFAVAPGARRRSAAPVARSAGAAHNPTHSAMPPLHRLLWARL
jgi:hypothetical protein